MFCKICVILEYGNLLTHLFKSLETSNIINSIAGLNNQADFEV